MDGHGAHADTAASWVAFEALVLGLLTVAAASYAAALWVSRHGRTWPLRRPVFWYAGLLCVAAALVGPLAAAARAGFVAHMVGHLLLGMLAPLLLTLGTPVTLGLRALPVAEARQLSRLLRSVGVRVVTYPVTAAVLNAGGLWLLYTSDVFQLMHSSVLVHAVVHAHILVAGYLFTASIIAVEPGHRASVVTRSVVLVVFIAAHSILAKWLYAHPPVGVDLADARAGAQLMYYGGDIIDVTLIVLMFAGWYRATRPRHTLSPRTPRTT